MTVFKAVLAIAMGIAMACGSAQAQSVGPRLALVIGNDDYRELPKLVGAVNDAHAVADALKARGFKVTQASNLGRAAMIALLADFERSLASGGGVGQSAFDSLPNQKNSPFTIALLRALTQRGDDLQELFQGVREGVETAFRDPALSNFKQTPDISGQLRSKFFFNHPDRDPAGSVTRIVILDASRDNPFAAAPSR